MKRTFILAALVLTLTAAVPAHAGVGSAFGALATANPVGQGKADLGFAVGLADGTSFIGTFNYGLSEFMTGRAKLALWDADGTDTKMTFGADVSWQFLDADLSRNRPFDLAAGGMFEYVSFDYGSVTQLGAFITGSYPFRLKGGTLLTPYTRLNGRMEMISWDFPGIADDSESNLEIGFNGGVKWQMSETLSFFGELQLDGNDGVFFGLNLGVM